MRWLGWLALLSGALAADPSIDECLRELSDLKEQLGKCETTLKQIEDSATDSSSDQRAQYQALKDKVHDLEEKVKEREKTLADIEVENDKLHKQLIERVQSLALVQRADPVDDWDCMELCSSTRLDLQRCEARKAIMGARQWDSRQNWDMLHKSEQRKIDILKWRLDSLDQTIDLAKARRERMRNQIEALKGVTLARTSRSAPGGLLVRVSPPSVLPGGVIPAPHAFQAARVAAKAIRGGGSISGPPRAELENRLAAAEGEERDLKEKLNSAKTAAADAKKLVEDAHARIDSLSQDITTVKTKTVEAFKVAFTLDTKLTKLEDEHEVAMDKSKEATDRWEAAFEKSNVAEFHLGKNQIEIARIRHQLHKIDTG